MLEIFLLLAPLFGIILAGYLTGITGIADKQWIKILNLFGYYIAFPALIFKSIAQADISLSLHGGVILAQLGLGIGLLFAMFWIGKIFGLHAENRNTLLISAYFVNSGYIGIPALEIVFGAEAAAAGAVTVAVMILIVFTIGVAILERSRKKTVDLKDIIMSIIKNPLLWAAAMGLLLGFSHIEMYVTIERFISFLAGAASPTVLVALGIFLAINRPERATIKFAAIITAIKMLLIPAVFTVIVILFNDSEWLKITYIQASMPVAITAFAFAEIYPMNKAVISTAILFSTLSSVLIIPLVMWVTTVI